MKASAKERVTCEDTVTVITTIAPAHIENLGSEEAIANAKAEIFALLDSESPQDRNWAVSVIRRSAASVWLISASPCARAPGL